MRPEGGGEERMRVGGAVRISLNVKNQNLIYNLPSIRVIVCVRSSKAHV